MRLFYVVMNRETDDPVFNENGQMLAFSNLKQATAVAHGDEEVAEVEWPDEEVEVE